VVSLQTVVGLYELRRFYWIRYFPLFVPTSQQVVFVGVFHLRSYVITNRVLFSVERAVWPTISI